MIGKKRVLLVLSVLLVVSIASFAWLSNRPTNAPRWPGVENKGVVLLPNGWKIAPAGRHLQVGDFPMAMVLSPDGRYAVISNSGRSKPALTIVDLRLRQVREQVEVQHAWLGLAWHPDGKRLYSSGAAENTVYEFAWADGRLTPAATFSLGRPQQTIAGEHKNLGFVGGLAVSPDGKTLFAVQVLGQSVTALEIDSGRIGKSVPLAAEPYACLLSADGKTLFVSLWGGAKVLLFDAKTLDQTGEVPVGEHPNAMALSREGERLFVACANTNRVWVIDLASRAAREQICVTLFPDSPPGTTPNALGLSPDGATLLVANADNNTVAVVDVARPGGSEVEGFIPTGWYPTATLFASNGTELLVLNGKGLTSMPNPRGPQPGHVYPETQYVAAMLHGSLSIIGTPDRETLRELTRTVYQITPYSDARKLAPPEARPDSPIPKKVGDRSPIKHVFYIIRENRTYDQVLGDMEKGNGDPNLTLFGEEVTPNAHALAREFVLFDNFYVDAEVSYDGHAFSTAAYATDVVEKIWPTNYARRGGVYFHNRGFERRNPYGNLSAPPEGYIWDFARRAGVSVRSYGEFGDWEHKGGPVEATVPGLEGLVHPSYAPFDLGIPDNERVDVWLKEFLEFKANGNLPRLSIIQLGNDHTAGTRPGFPTPRSMVAENDRALGRVVEAISKSRYWRDSAVFVLEDDAQNGPDHVDAHRSVALVASPYARRGALDSTLYTTSGMLRTIELILGLPPMSQYDAAATPFYNAFQAKAVATPYELRPARVPLDERNAENAPGARASLAMNLEEVDVAPELELNGIIWKSVRGISSAMPPPVRAAFIRPIADEEDQEEDEEEEERERR